MYFFSFLSFLHIWKGKQSYVKNNQNRILKICHVLEVLETINPREVNWHDWLSLKHSYIIRISKVNIDEYKTSYFFDHETTCPKDTLLASDPLSIQTAISRALQYSTSQHGDATISQRIEPLVKTLIRSQIMIHADFVLCLNLIWF